MRPFYIVCATIWALCAAFLLYQRIWLFGGLAGFTAVSMVIVEIRYCRVLKGLSGETGIPVKELKKLPLHRMTAEQLMVKKWFK